MLNKLITNKTAECVGDKKRCYASQEMIDWELDVEIWFDAIKCHLKFHMTEGF
jgi:hypothetical protein